MKQIDRRASGEATLRGASVLGGNVVLLHGASCARGVALEDHPRPSVLFQLPLSKLKKHERDHVRECRDCDLYSQLREAVSLADEMPAEPVPAQGSEIRFGGLRAARLILQWWAHSCRGAWRAPHGLRSAARGLIAALLLISKTTLGRTVASIARRVQTAVNQLSEMTAYVDRRSEILRTVALPARRYKDMRAAWASHMVSALAQRAHDGVEPDDRLARSLSFRRVVLPAKVPQFALLRLQPKVERRRDIAVVVPSLFVPAAGERQLRLGTRLHERGLHVLIVDPVQAGATDWWSPLARSTAGWAEGWHLVEAVADLLRQLGDRARHVWFIGTGLGATIALWGLVHARHVGVDVHRVLAVAPVTHLGAAVSHIEPRRRTAFFDVWRSDFEFRRFYGLMMDERRARHRRLLHHVHGMRDYLRDAGVDEHDLVERAPEWDEFRRAERSTTVEGRVSVPGDLLAAVPELRPLSSRITLIAGERDTVVPYEHSRRLAVALGLEIQRTATSNSWVDGDRLADDTCGRLLVDEDVAPEDAILGTLECGPRLKVAGSI
jgi:hypothetical protein